MSSWKEMFGGAQTREQQGEQQDHEETLPQGAKEWVRDVSVCRRLSKALAEDELLKKVPHKAGLEHVQNNNSIRELKDEHGKEFVNTTILLGKAILLSGDTVKTTIKPQQALAVSYALVSLGIMSYSIQHHNLNNENKMVFEFSKEQIGILKAEQQYLKKHLSAEQQKSSSVSL